MSEIGDFLKHYVFGHVAPMEFMGGLKKEIENSLSVDAGSTIEEIKKGAKKIEESYMSSVVDAPSHGHLELCSSLLSAYKTLLPAVGTHEDTTELLSRAMMEGVNNFSMRTSLRVMLDSCKDNPDRLKEIFSWLMAQYGASFEWSAVHKETDREDGFTLEIQRCYYFSFFSSHDAPFLTPILCQLDSLWFEMVDPAKHGFSFDKSRYQTQGYGAPKCVFPIVMKKDIS